MKNFVRAIKELGLVLLTTIVCGVLLTLLLILIYCIPLNNGNFAESVEILSSEGDRPDILERNSGEWENAGSFEPGILSTTNELANLYRAAGCDDRSPVYNAIAMDSPEWGPYPRYWHAYAGVMRILLLFLDIKEMRFAGFLFQMLIIIAIMQKISGRKGKTAALIFLTSYVLMMPLAVSMNTVYSLGLSGVLVWTLFIICMIEKKGDKFTDSRFLLLSFCLMGCTVCALDQMITCIIAWALPAMVIIYLTGEKNTLLQNIRTVVLSGISWIIGYAGLWVFKIALATAYLGGDVLGEAIDRSSFWTEGGAENSPGRLFSLYTSYKHYTYKIFAIIIVLWIVWLSFRMLRTKLSTDVRIPALALIALGPVVWNLVLYEHVYWHHIMTYRQLSVSVVCLLYIMFISSGENAPVCDLTAVLRKVVFLCVVLGLSALLTSRIREQQDVYNADLPGMYMPFSEENPEMVMDIVPSYGRITEFSLGIDAVSEKGEYIFRLTRGGELVDEFIIPASEYYETSWKPLSVDWPLKKGVDYKLSITASGTEPGSGLYVLPDANGTVNDLTGLVVGGVPSPVQPITWIKYDRPPLRRDFVFYSFSFYMIICAMFLVGSCIVIHGKDKTK